MDRYQRQIILPGFGVETQQKLQDARVLVIGAGGLGCPVLQYLTSAGVGTLGIVDFDTVSLTNLHRQTLYNEADIGRKKVELAKERLTAQNNSLKCEIYDEALTSINVFNLIENYDIVADCTDSIATRYLINDVCALLQKPLVYASIYQFEGQISVFHYEKNTRNLRDIFPQIPEAASVISCNEAGVLGVLTGIMGGLQANEIIKIITRTGTVHSGKILLYDSCDNCLQHISFESNDSIFRAKNKTDILTQDYGFACTQTIQIENRKALEQVLENAHSVIVDVRNEDELPKVNIFKSRQIPLSELEARLNELSETHLVFFCQSGARSIEAIKRLQNKMPSKIFYNIKNGIKIFEL